MAVSYGHVRGSTLCKRCHAEALDHLADVQGNLPTMNVVLTWMIKEECECCRREQTLVEKVWETAFPAWYQHRRLTPVSVVCTDRMIRDAQKCANSGLSQTYNVELGLARKIEENAERSVTGMWQQLVYGEAIMGGMLRCREWFPQPELTVLGTLIYGCLAGVGALCVVKAATPLAAGMVWRLPQFRRGTAAVASHLAWDMVFRPAVTLNHFMCTDSPSFWEKWASPVAKTLTFLAGSSTVALGWTPMTLRWCLKAVTPCLFVKSRPTVCGVRERTMTTTPAAVQGQGPPATGGSGSSSADTPPDTSTPPPGTRPSADTNEAESDDSSDDEGPRLPPPEHPPPPPPPGAGVLPILEMGSSMDATRRQGEQDQATERGQDDEDQPEEANAQDAEPPQEAEEPVVPEPPGPPEITGPVDANTLPAPDDRSVGYLCQHAGRDGVIKTKRGTLALSLKAFNPDCARQNDKPAPLIMMPPDGIQVEHWSSCDSNIEAALYKRAVMPGGQPALTCTLPYPERQKLRKQMLKLCGKNGPFSPAKIAAWASEVLTNEELNPKSWTFAKWKREHERAMLDTSLRVGPGVAIKDEVLEWSNKNKPRFLLADKEAGQVAARFVIKCFDALWFAFRKGRHLKYMPKGSAMEQVAYDFGRKLGYPTAVCEGDGSAWDSCCNIEIRNDTENIILHHILRELLNHGLFAQHLGEAHETICTDDRIGVKSKVQLKSDEGRKYIIDSIRRSGHAGTSGLNGFINAVLWSFTLTTEVCTHLACGPKQHVLSRYTAVGGEKIKVSGTNSYEGDDSLLLLPLSLRVHEQAIQDRWRSYGFHMKIFWRVDGMSTYTGYDFLTKNGRLCGAKVPSIRRNVLGCSFTISPEARKGWQDGQMWRVFKVAADTMLARATAFEHDCAPLAHAYGLAAEYYAAKVQDYVPSDELQAHKNCETTLRGTMQRVRSNARPPTDDDLRLWQLSLDGLPGNVSQCAALEQVDPLSQHFLHKTA